MVDRECSESDPEELHHFLSWLQLRGTDLLNAVLPAAQSHWGRIPKGAFDRQLLDAEDLLQAATLQLMLHPVQRERRLTFRQTCGLLGIFVKRYAQDTARKQRRRDEFGLNFGSLRYMD